jgi:hypothetical protein
MVKYQHREQFTRSKNYVALDLSPVGVTVAASTISTIVRAFLLTADLTLDGGQSVADCTRLRPTATRRKRDVPRRHGAHGGGTERKKRKKRNG